jgi:hypothetical protein
MDVEASTDTDTDTELDLETGEASSKAAVSLSDALGDRRSRGDAVSLGDAGPTSELYEGLDGAFRAFNAALFDGQLPGCVITLSRKARTPGFYHPSRWLGAREGAGLAGEIVLHPSYLTTRPILVSLAELVHQMVHHAQASFGKLGRDGYHNQQFAAWMDEIGLVSTTHGNLADLQTGQTIQHLIVEDGPFHRAAAALITSEFRLAWLDRHPPAESYDEPSVGLVSRADVAAARATRKKQTPVLAPALIEAAVACLPEPNRGGDGADSAADDLRLRPFAGESQDEAALQAVPAPGNPADALPRPRTPAGSSAAHALGPAQQELIKRADQRAQSKARRKYVCEHCGDAFWGRPGLDAQCRKDTGLFIDAQASAHPTAVAEAAPEADGQDAGAMPDGLERLDQAA